MTTAPRTRHTGSTGRGSASMRPALALTALTAVVAGALGLVLTGAPAALGALVGGALVVLFFGLGTVVLAVVARHAPALSMVVALVTYALQVVLLAAVLLVLQASGLLVADLDPRWLGGTVIAATVVWLGAHVGAAARARVPAYDVALPGPYGRREAGAP